MDEEQARGSWSNQGLTIGFGAGMLFGAVRVYAAYNTGRMSYWLYPLQWLGYFVAARIASELKYRAQQDDLDALAGVKLAGTGAALVSSLLVWVLLGVYWVFFDLMQINRVIFDPSLFFFGSIVDVAMAIAVGTLGGTLITHKHRNFLE